VPRRLLSNHSGYLCDLEEHWRRFWAVTEHPPRGLERQEAKFFVEANGVRLRIDYDAGTADLVRHLVRKHEHPTKEQTADTLALVRFVDCEPSQAQHGNLVTRESLAL
jgi:hypothetical protein